MFRLTNGAIAAAVLLTAGCSTVGGNGDSFAEQIEDIAESWQDAKDDVEKGKKLVERGRDDVKDGEGDVQEHSKKQKRYERELAQARESYQAAQLLSGATAARNAGAVAGDGEKDEALERLEDRVDDLEDEVKDERRRVEKARRKIREGRERIARGEELIKKGERGMIEAETAYARDGGGDPDFFDRLF